MTAIDRETLRQKWESSDPDLDNPDQGARAGRWGSQSSDDGYEGDPFDAIFGGLGGGLGSGLYHMHHPAPHAPKVDAYGNPVGVTPRLVTVRSSPLHQLVLSSPCSFLRRLDQS